MFDEPTHSFPNAIATLVAGAIDLYYKDGPSWSGARLYNLENATFFLPDKHHHRCNPNQHFHEGSIPWLNRLCESSTDIFRHYPGSPHETKSGCYPRIVYICTHDYFEGIWFGRVFWKNAWVSFVFHLICSPHCLLYRLFFLLRAMTLLSILINHIHTYHTIVTIV